MLVSGDQLRFGTAGTWTRQADDVKASDPVTEARQAARRGEVDVAIPALRRFADEGDDAACASLAYPRGGVRRSDGRSARQHARRALAKRQPAAPAPPPPERSTRPPP